MAIATPPHSRETLFVRVALALCVVAVIDDVAPQYARALGPLAVALLIGVAYPRLRVGARATLAIVCGMVALVAAIADNADHLTALVAGVAAAGMAIDGARRLWGERRRDGRWLVRRGLLALGAVLGVYFVVLPI